MAAAFRWTTRSPASKPITSPITAPCAGAIPDVMETELRGRGYSVVRNKPYAGGFITEHYGRPGRGLHALQIEVNRSLYIDEVTLQKRDDFEMLAAAISSFMQQMAEYVQEFAQDQALAAE